MSVELNALYMSYKMRNKSLLQPTAIYIQIAALIIRKVCVFLDRYGKLHDYR